MPGLMISRKTSSRILGQQKRRLLLIVGAQQILVLAPYTIQGAQGYPSLIQMPTYALRRLCLPFFGPKDISGSRRSPCPSLELAAA